MGAMQHPPEEDIVLTRVLYALSDEGRLAIVRRLGAKGVATCAELEDGRPKSSMSHHFRVLRQCGVVRTEVAGTSHLNSLRREELDRRFPGVLAAILAV
ncbi:ArsR/SmtB family transcription factor [Rhizosaccharibacter radicis]|uniref:Helix-turn-helix domain-containing protein n=1 Tax=Rhizosaccharibacter radicis TaxID=2782605 RepID=A0ABT1W0B7_9PROT|nr:helix-turn-helix domain-containing protein [Acetobacteraceae bacterium KSS12]